MVYTPTEIGFSIVLPTLLFALLSSILRGWIMGENMYFKIVKIVAFVVFTGFCFICYDIIFNLMGKTK